MAMMDNFAGSTPHEQQYVLNEVQDSNTATYCSALVGGKKSYSDKLAQAEFAGSLAGR